MDKPFGPESLGIDSAYYNALDIRSFMLMLKDPSYCYKFYWLEAIVNLISENVTETTFNDIIDEMICNAWYSVREFHIHLSGVIYKDKDNLERAVNKLHSLSNLSISLSLLLTDKTNPLSFNKRSILFLYLIKVSTL